MKIRDLLDRDGPLFSFEFFPPKSDSGMESLYATIDHLRELRPSFVSVTYGAGGSTRARTVELVTRIKHELGIETMAHLTCVGAGQHEIRSVLDQLCAGGIENVLALRGDPPKGETVFVPAPDGFTYASELVAFIRGHDYPFCLGGACYPEGHVEAANRDTDLAHLRTKVQAGLEFVITQLFFDNGDYFDFVARARRRNIAVPIIPGIMPITNVAQIERFTRLCGAHIPTSLQAQLDAVRDDDTAVQAVGVEHAAAQCRDLLARGAPGIHFYTLNKSPATRAILERLRG